MNSKKKKSRVLLDTSVWIVYFRDPSTPIKEAVRHLVNAGQATIAGPVVFEVLQGTRSPQEFEEIRRLLEGLPYLTSPEMIWVAAAGMAAGLRRRGLTIPGTDCLVATLARENDCKIWSLDAHFESIPGVRLYRPPRPRPRRPSA